MSEVKNGKYVNNKGIIRWYKNDLLHREDGPAVEDPTSEGRGYKEWYIEGKRHREDGFAFELFGEGRYFLHGVQYTEEEFNQYLAKKQLNETLSEDLDIKNSKPKVKI